MVPQSPENHIFKALRSKRSLVTKISKAEPKHEKSLMPFDHIVEAHHKSLEFLKFEVGMV